MSASPGNAGLSGQDLSFLAWESEARPMHIAARAEFRCAPGAVAPTLEELRAFLDPRVRSEPRLLARLQRRRWPRRPAWAPAPAFRIEDHVREPGPALGPRAATRREDALLAAPLDLERPPWEVWLVRGDGTFTLLIKVHHVLIDGIAGMALLERLLGGRLRTVAPRRPRASRPRGRRSGLLRSLAGYAAEHFRAGARTPLNGAVGKRRHFRASVDAESFERVSRRLGGTANDGVLAAVSGALRSWLLRETLELPHRPLRAFCPVSLRSPGQAGGFGNRISAWFVPLPLAEADPAARVAGLQRETGVRKRQARHTGGDAMASLVARFGAWLARLGMAVAARRRAYGIVVTNVPGPSRPLEMLGARLVDLHAFVPLFPGQRLSVAVVRYAGRLRWGVTSGFEDRVRGARFVADLDRELRRFGEPEVGTEAA